MRKVLMLSSTHNDLGTIRSLRKLGAYIIATGNVAGFPGQVLCDEYIGADYSDKDKILSIAKEQKVDGVMQCCNDFGVCAAAYVSERLGLVSGYDSYETTLTLHNKDRFKALAEKLNLLTPRARAFSEMDEAVSYAKAADYPIIIKPVDLSGGKGISKASGCDEVLNAVKLAFQRGKCKKIVIEPFITGSQHGFCAFLRNRKVIAVCSNNEYSFEDPFRVEIDTFPADNFEEVAPFLIEEIEKIAEYLKLTDGIFHLQYIYDGKKPHIIECMRRILGNMYHVPGNLLMNTDFEYYETRAKLGLSLDTMSQNIQPEGFFAYKTLLAPKNGIIKSINIPKFYKKYLFNEYYLKNKGDAVTNYISEQLGFLFFMFPDAKTMKNCLIDNYSNDIVETG